MRALEALDGSFFQGRIVHLLPARPLVARAASSSSSSHGGAEGGGGGGANRGYKEKKDAQQKAQAGSSHNWNSLFMRADAVGEAVAERYGVAKRDLLDTMGGAEGGGAEGASLAVRLAQGETHLIAQTKTWLASKGVSLEALEQHAAASSAATRGGGGAGGGGGGGGAGAGAGAGAGGPRRSQTLLLVKNLSPKVTQHELSALFSRHGTLAQVLIPPARTLALVEFVEVGDAKRAFRAVAYSKLHGAPIFLEWAPVGVLGGDAPDEADAASASAAPGAAASGAAGDDDEDGASYEAEGCTIFVKNLNFETEAAALRALFERHWRVRAATVAKRRDPATPGGQLSMGYGFVELCTAADAQQALRKMANSRLDEHVLQLKLSSRASASSAPGGVAAGTKAAKRGRDGEGGGEGGGGGGAAKPSSKLAVRNVPFEASKREVKELFAAFGQLKTLRLPKKFDGSHRGFAFVEFVSKAEAAKALHALQSTHLYGRKIVVAYAEAEQSVDEMRKKMRSQLADATSSLGKRSRNADGADGGDGGGDGELGFDI